MLDKKDLTQINSIVETSIKKNNKFIEASIKENNKVLIDKMFKTFATKDELKAEISWIKENMMTKDDKNEILNVVDGLAKKHSDFEVEMTSNLSAHERFNKRLNSHGRQIKSLELACA